MLCRYVANQVHRGLGHSCQIGGLRVTVHVHVEDAWTFKEKVIMQGGYFDPVLQESGHNWIDFVLSQDEVAHHYVHSTVAFVSLRNPVGEFRACSFLCISVGNVNT